MVKPIIEPVWLIFSDRDFDEVIEAYRKGEEHLQYKCEDCRYDVLIYPIFEFCPVCGEKIDWDNREIP